MTQATTAVEFDPFSMEFYNGAQDIYARLRAEAPVYTTTSSTTSTH